MSGANTQRAESPEDFGNDKRGIAARWIAELRLAERDSERFIKRAKRTEAIYMDERRSAEAEAKRMNIFWSNVQTLKPAIYATPPKAVVQRRYLDQDPIARAASTILQRAIQTNIDQTGWHDATDLSVQDYLVVGRGTCWARYEPHFEDVGAGDVSGVESPETMGADAQLPNSTAQLPNSLAQPASPPGYEAEDHAPTVEGEIADDGVQITDDAEGQVVTYEEVCWDYVNWNDFIHAPARTWPEVRWVARRVLMERDELVERFGAKIGNAVPMTWRPEGLDETDPAVNLFMRARVFEIWNKPKREVVWICPDYGDEPLDRRDDPLGLTEFFPCPRPLYATLSNSSLMPAADYAMYQDQASELDSLTARISALARAIKATAFYNASVSDLQRLFDEESENMAIPVTDWGTFQAGAGFKGAVDFMPLDTFAMALKQLMEVREQTKRDLYEITGISDIVRGQGMASATATAERLKGQFAQLRLRDRVGQVARFCRDMVRITGEIIAKHFQPETLLLLSDYQQTVGASPEVAMQAIELLKHDQTRGFRLEIEVDSTIIADQEQEQQSRVAFLQMAGQFLAEAVPLAQQVPALGPLAGQMLLFGIRGFPVGREMEAVFETALEQLQQAAQQPQEQQPNPEIVKAQAEAQTAQMEMQQRAQAEQQKMQLEAMKAQMQQQIEEAKLALEAQKLELDREKIMLEGSRMAQDGANAEAERSIKLRALDADEREKAATRATGEVTAISDAIANMQGMLDAITAKADEAYRVASAPRKVTIERGPDGRAIGARQEVEAI